MPTKVPTFIVQVLWWHKSLAGIPLDNELYWVALEWMKNYLTMELYINEEVCHNNKILAHHTSSVLQSPSKEFQKHNTPISKQLISHKLKNEEEATV